MSEKQGLWHRFQPATRRFIRAAGVWVLTGLIATAWGVLSASYTGAVGPHAARYSTTLNNEITFDMGPLGALIIDSPLPLRLGVDIKVGEIPEELTLDGDTVVASGELAIAALTADLESYTQFFASPTQAITTAARGLGDDALARAVLAWSMLLTGILLGRLAAHGVLRAAFASAWRRQGVSAVTIVLGLISASLLIAPATQGSGGAGSVSSVLENTPLQDARIKGRLRLLIDHYGKFVIDEIEKNQKFYDEVTLNLLAALATDPEAKGPRAPLTPMAQVAGDVDPDADAAEQEDGVQSEDLGGVVEEEAAGEPASMRVQPDLITLMLVSDLHCNIGMGQVAGVIAAETGVELIINLGDNVIGGTSVEGFCIDSFADSFGDLPVVVANGNHDSKETGAQERARGWHVLDGSPIEVEGIRFLGDFDATITTLGAPSRQLGDENHAARGARLSQVACAERDSGTPIDMLLMHNHRTTEEALDSGCVDYAFAGHFHRRIGPWQRGLGVQYVHTSSAGATVNKPTIGPLSGTAGITVMTWDRANREPVAMRSIQAFTDARVTVSPWYSWPQPAIEPVHHDWPTLEEAPW